MKQTLLLLIVAIMGCKEKQEFKGLRNNTGIHVDFSDCDADSVILRGNMGGEETVWINPNLSIDYLIAYPIKDTKSNTWGVYAKDFFDAETWGCVTTTCETTLFVLRELSDYYPFKSKIEADSICQKYTSNYREYSKIHAADQKQQAKLNNHFKPDSSIAYIKYNSKIKKYAVWARNYEGNDAWNYLFRTWQGSLFLIYSDKPFDLYSTKEEALKVCEEYTQNYKRYAESHATAPNQRNGFK